jgi:hypothetical protein
VHGERRRRARHEHQGEPERPVGQPSQIDLDEVCGRSDDATRIRADALWRITPAHHLRFTCASPALHLRFMFFGNKTDRSRTVERKDFDGRLCR